MADPLDPITLARGVLSMPRTRYVGQTERVDEILARAVIALTEERDALRRTLGSARASIRLVLNRDKISEWTAGALREAETEIDAALRGKEGT